MSNSFLFFSRLLSRNIIVSSLKSVGFILGLLVFSITFLVYDYHNSFESWVSDSESIYKISFQTTGREYMGSDRFGVTSAPLVPAIRENFPQVSASARVYKAGELFVRNEINSQLVKSCLAVDYEFFNLIPFSFKYGSKEAFMKPFSVVISESTSRLLFGEENPIGRSLQPESYKELSHYTITGVYYDIPENSIFVAEAIFSFEFITVDQNPKAEEQWDNRSYHSFIKVNDERDLPSILGKATEMRDAAQEDSTKTFAYFVEPIKDLHFSEGINFDYGNTIDKSNISAVLIIGFIILLISSFNIVNLSTAETFKRYKEISIRKSVGASRRELIKQYMLETLYLIGGLMGVMLIIIYISLPILNSFLGFDLDPFSNQQFLIITIFVTVLLVVLTSLYPAFILSRLNPSRVLKFSDISGALGVNLRNSLVIFQFLLTGALMVVSIGVYDQLNFMLNTDPGYRKKGILTIRVQDRKIRSNEEVRRQIKLRALEHPGIEKASYSSQPINKITSQNGRKWIQETGEEQYVSLYTLHTDKDFLDVFDIKIKEGEGFSEVDKHNKGRYILNETAVEEIGINNLVGRTIIEGKDTIKVSGIMNDFHGLSMRQPIRPTRLLTTDNGWWGFLNLRISGDYNEIMTYMQGIFSEYSDYPFAAHLFDEQYAKLYEKESKTMALVSLLTGIAIFISCLGLFGILLQMFEQRQRELGIRKTLGGRLDHLGWILSRQLLLPILFAWLISMPIAQYILDSWLSNFAFHSGSTYSLYLISLFILVISLAISLIYTMYRVSRLNPVEILKSE